ncbi:SDR family NAD(P)-dependent oxidoreductase [Paractinoplanes atraurantiacus]|uniref:NAD(P)-dependent dehydrogenase, short-chain alcohol dehydrogenase family n=1 Tax=Paractinoplanes atraurantiacus TaxID=1036182 RepID=A0A285KIC4_9ACTN|nr:SDR family NAD(P)-dependent oxidoreductase [Actinoplanes atraurantiacus]SNY71051.1 NAD(P)-dependent dehydrogenase, short-chain alcohol dehydrogenase family [Actinoplanes atraurantiacus]
MALTAGSTVGDWLSDAEGGPALRELLGQGGFDESVLTPVRQLPLQQMVALSQGKLPQEVIDALVLRVNNGVVPDVTSSAWRERIMAGRFTGKTIVVTGAASGIGRAVASRITREGGRVVAVDIADISDNGVKADITSADDVRRVIETAGERIDGLANIAGVVDDFTPAHEVSDTLWRKVFAVNVDGVLNLTRAVLPSMLAHKSGSIVNVASEAALRGNAAGIAYTASKHAVVGITKSCAFMYGLEGIRVNAVAPGGVATGMQHNPGSEFGAARTGSFLRQIPPIATAEQLAASITFLLGDDGANINGAILPSDGGWSVQ